MKKKKVSENYLEKKPKRKDGLRWEASEDGVCTLSVENRGFFNRLFQLLLKKPKISYVHLDEMGSFLWQRFDGEKDLILLGEEFKANFGDKAEPLYPRVAKYVQILHSYGFVTFD